jgi:DNA-binding HxlR family transcriptional regulator
MKKSENLYIGCPVQYSRQYLSGKWQMGILWNLRNEALRFGELKRSLPGLADKTLMQELEFFMDRKIISRHTSDVPFSRIEYSLTEQGKSLIPIINSIVEWGFLYLQEEKINPQMNPTPSLAIQNIESHRTKEK